MMLQVVDDPDASKDTFEGLIPKHKQIWEGGRGVSFYKLKEKLKGLYMKASIEVVLVGFDGAGWVIGTWVSLWMT